MIDSVMDLHLLCKALWLKLAEQAKNQKTVLGAMPGAHHDARNVARGRDQQVVSMANPQATKTFPFAGADVGNVSFLSVAENEYNKGAGNPNMLGGQGQAADTATQEVLIERNANVVIDDMETVFLRFVTGILKDVAWYTWNAPSLRFEYEKRIRGTSYKVHAAFDSTNLEGDLEDFGILVRHFSMAPDPASRELNAIERYLNLVYGPLREQFHTQGGEIDVAEITEEYAEKLGSEALPRIFRFGRRREPGEGETPGMSPTSNRTDARRPQPGGGEEDPLSAFADTLNTSNRQNAMMQAQTPQL
jgi:hypothetical protein